MQMQALKYGSERQKPEWPLVLGPGELLALATISTSIAHYFLSKAQRSYE